MQSERTGGPKEDGSGGTNVHDNVVMSNSSLVPPGSMEGSLEDSEPQGFRPDDALLPGDPMDPQSAIPTKQATVGQDGSQDEGRTEKAKSDHPFDNMEGVDLPDYVKTHDTHLTFPEKLMLMLMHIEGDFTVKGKPIKEAPIAWSMQGKAFVIRDREEFIRIWLPMFFRSAKFSSFTRKLYRWGFRQISSPRGFDSGSDRELYFFNSNFQKSHKILMANMSSVTAETKRQQQRRESSSSSADVALPLALAHYPFAEAKEQNIGDMFLSSQLAQFQQAGMAQSALDFQMNMSPNFGLMGQSLNNALASQLSNAGPTAFFGTPQQQRQQNSQLGITPGPNPMPMYPQSFQQQIPQNNAGQTNMNTFQQQQAQPEAARQWTLQQLQLLGFAPQQQISSNAQALSGDPNAAFNMAGGAMGASGGWGGFTEANQLVNNQQLASVNSQQQMGNSQQQLANNQQMAHNSQQQQQMASGQQAMANSQQLAELVFRYGASNVPSLQQSPGGLNFPQPPGPSSGG